VRNSSYRFRSRVYHWQVEIGQRIVLLPALVDCINFPFFPQVHDPDKDT
jgi:hypothetical protein